MQYTTIALFIAAATTVSASAPAPQAYGSGENKVSAQVYTFETRKAIPTKEAEVYEDAPETKAAHYQYSHPVEEPKATGSFYQGYAHQEQPKATGSFYQSYAQFEQPKATHAPAAYGQDAHNTVAYHAEPTKSAHPVADPIKSHPVADPIKTHPVADPIKTHPVADPIKAHPTKAAHKPVPSPDPATVCAQGSDISCCTTDSSGSDFLGNVLGGSCILQNLSLLSSLNSNCPAANTFCCPTNQDGFLNINLSCIPISL